MLLNLRIWLKLHQMREYLLSKYVGIKRILIKF